LIRQASPADVPWLCGLLSELFSIEADFTADSRKQAQGLNLLIKDASGSSAIFVAEESGEIVGMGSVQILISTAEGGPTGFVEDLIVLRKCRGKGIGTAILSEIVNWCNRKEVTRLQLLRDADNGDALLFYAAQGWKGTNLVCMRKML
jgi:GNAT superfamily N-acetyltransferase